MKKSLTLILTTIFFCKISFAQFESAKQVYKANNYKEVIERHKTVAILPIKATISYKKTPKEYSAEANAEEEKKLGMSMQQGMYTYLLRKEDDYTVKFQDVERTNALLKKANIMGGLDEVLPDSICKILNVDAVIRCTYQYEKTASETGALVSTLLIGTGKTGSGGLVMQINDGKDGELVWRFYKEMNETLTSNANEIMERMMKKVARNFPYKK